MMGRGLIGCFIDALCDWVSLCFFFQYVNVRRSFFFRRSFLCVFLTVLRVEKVSRF